MLRTAKRTNLTRHRQSNPARLIVMVQKGRKLLSLARITATTTDAEIEAIAERMYRKIKQGLTAVAREKKKGAGAKRSEA
jgi:hypothetical protein